jgi:hypothetical protein
MNAKPIKNLGVGTADTDAARIADVIGWATAGETWTYASADAPTFTFTISGDKTAKYSPGMRIKLTQVTGGTKYFIITVVSFVSPNTTITIYGGTDYTLNNEAISSPFYSTQKAPQGFPLDPAKWTIELYRYGSDITMSNPAANTWYNVGDLSIIVPIGVWVVYSRVPLLGARSTSDSLDMQFTLATSTGSETHSRLTLYAWSRPITGLSVICFGRNILNIATKTTYFLNLRTLAGGVTTLGYSTIRSALSIELVSTYL